VEKNETTDTIMKIVVRNVNFLNKRVEKIAVPVFAIALKLIFYLPKRIKIKP
jgi:hypothetical protein